MSPKIHRLEDVDRLTAWRAEVIRAVFSLEPSSELLAANRQYYEQQIPAGEHMAVVATLDGVEAGCGAVCFSRELPSPDNPSGRCGYLMNIYVREPYRGRGIGHAIVKELVKTAREAGCDKIYLETTAEGRPLYISAGFRNLAGIMKYDDIQS